MNILEPDNSAASAAEESVRDFYDSYGWSTDGEHSRDASLWEDTRDCAQSYISACRLRVCNYLPKEGEILVDAGSGPLQYPEYLAYSTGFSKRVCIDVSRRALILAEEKLGTRGEYIECSILELPLPTNYADASISMHTIYHIEASAQEAAVRQLLRVTKPRMPLLVVYANPNRLSSRIAHVVRRLTALATTERGRHATTEIYYHAHPLSWWSRFSDVAEIKIATWRTLTARMSRVAVPDNALGSASLRGLFWLEETFPRAMLPFAAYPLIVLRKR